MTKMKIHILANAHLDPVWQWDWREGLNEGLTTVRSMVNLLEEDPELTFLRGESIIYEHVEKYDPDTFKRMRKLIEEGRWDVVGGTYLQSDTNMPATETFARLFLHGQEYFRSRFGKCPEVAWFADSFGHSAGLPEIFTECGIKAFAFTRPPQRRLPMEKPVFWWKGPGGARLLCYRALHGYCQDRFDTKDRLNHFVEVNSDKGLQNLGYYLGIGNHGGGTTRGQIAELREWTQEHPEVEVIHSGLHRLFEALFKEISEKGENFIPTHRDEMNFVLRGCYVSMAKFKFPYRRMEAEVASTEALQTAINSKLQHPPTAMNSSWDDVCFNSFHDILPGSSMERAYDDQIAWLGRTRLENQRITLDAVNMLADKIDTRVDDVPEDWPCAVPVMVFNPHPVPLRTHAEIEVCLDYRPLWDYKDSDELPLRVLGPDNKKLSYQHVACEGEMSADFPWRKRVVVPMELPPMGWKLLEVGIVKGATKPKVKSSVAAKSKTSITNGIYEIIAKKGRTFIEVLRNGKAIFEKGLSFISVDDPWGSWGGMSEQPESLALNKVMERFKVRKIELLEDGPECAALWVRLAGEKSHIDLTFQLYLNRDAVDVSARVLWNDRYRRLKLVMPAGDQAEFEVPGGSVTRGPLGEVPGGRWVRVKGPKGNFGFASDALYGFDCNKGALNASIVRSTGYTKQKWRDVQDYPWRPLADLGEHRFKFIMTPGDSKLPQLAKQLEQPLVVQTVLPSPGELPRSGSIMHLKPANLQLLALKPTEDGNGIILRVQETQGKSTKPVLIWLDQEIKLDKVTSRKIATWRLIKHWNGWKAIRANILEKEQ